jgi:hypothetical protein
LICSSTTGEVPSNNASATRNGRRISLQNSLNGAAPPHDLALVTAGAEWRLRSNWSLMGRFDGEFGVGQQTYIAPALHDAARNAGCVCDQIPAQDRRLA